ncbi:hypothetical protein [Streptomyces formicae]|uniref:hypothetical protein n=1 Tax=Streptomyces formicae TaxID=1616117 RepID=UPI001F574412|nr:hypothetical protein [Streptomyces formicae]
MSAVDELAERLDDAIADAVHPDEIAALLEADGLTDEQIRVRYGREDSFALAEELYARRAEPVGRGGRGGRGGPVGAGPASGRAGPTLLSCLLRGLVFALPGLGYVLGAPTAYAPLLASALAGWAWNQALAHRAYTWLGLGDRAAAARTLRAGAPAGVLLCTTPALFVAAGDAPVLLFAAGQSLYLAAATALLVLTHGRGWPTWLRVGRAGLRGLRGLRGRAGTTGAVPWGGWRAGLRGLWGRAGTPGAGPGAPPGSPPRGPAGHRHRSVTRYFRRSPAGATLHGPSPAPSWCLPAVVARALGARLPAPVRRRTAGLSAGLWTGSSGHRSAVAGSDQPPTGRPARVLPTRTAEGRTHPRARAAAPSVGASVPYGLCGLGTGVLVLHVALDTPPFAVALTFAMGPAEYLLHRFRADSLAGMRASTTTRGFRAAVAAALARCLAWQLGTLLTFVGAVLLVWPDGDGDGGLRPGGAALAEALLLGVVLWSGLLLQAFGAVHAAAAVCCAAGLAAVLLPGAAPLVVPGAAAAVLAALVCVLLGRITSHR